MLDQAFINGTIITVNREDTVAEAFGVKKNKIAFVGSRDAIKAHIGPTTQVVDLKGKTLMPGLIDSHYHPILAGLLGKGPEAAMIDVFPKNCPSLKVLLDIIRDAVKKKQQGQWVSLMGYEPSLFPEKRHPTLEELDQVAPEHPVHCMHGGGHICMYNSKALAYLGVFHPEDARKYPEDEVEVIDGKLTGMVRGHTHFWLWGQVEYSEQAQAEAALKSQKHCLENGITSIHDCGELGKTSYHIMQKLCRNRAFKVRTYMMLHSIFGKSFSQEENDRFLDLGLMSGLGDDHFKIGSSKFMIDGGSGGPSCATREPYSHKPELPREKGWTRKEVAKYIAKINEAECQCTAHAIGDLAVEYMVEGYEKAFATTPRPDLRHRIEHCTLVDEDLVQRMAPMNICPSVNVGMIYSMGKNFARFYGKERNKTICALRTMLDKGVCCSLQSDVPSGPAGFQVIDAAVNRFDHVQHFQCDKTQAITLMEALRCATINGAYASYEEAIKGSLEVGKLADFIILSEDLTVIDPKEIHNIQVEQTYIDGALVFDRRQGR